MRVFGHLLACVVLVLQVTIAVPAFAEETAQSSDQTTAESIPFREDEVLARGFLLRVVWVTLLGVLVALAAVWLLRRFLYRTLPAGKDGTAIALISFKKLAPRISIYVIEIDHSRFAVVDSGSSMLHVPLPGKDDERDPTSD